MAWFMLKMLIKTPNKEIVKMVKTDENAGLRKNS